MMKFYQALLYCLLSFCPPIYSFKKNSIKRPIVVVVCSYNNEKWSKNTLDSIFNQEYDNFRLIIVDDCSSDNNVAVIQTYIDNHNLKDRVTFIKNTKRCRKLFNLYRVLYDCDDEEIVIMVDGDDCLAHPQVLDRINSTYDDENVWFTYGQYRNDPASQAIQWGFKEMGYCRPIPKHIQRKQAYRYYSFVYMHPRSFRAWLFKLVKLEDLIAEKIENFEGDFYPAANDVAMYFPMVEMAHTHIKFIPEILYIRNLHSEIVGFKVDGRIQKASAREIRKKNHYPVLFQVKKNRLDLLENALSDIFLLCRYNLCNIEKTLGNIQKNFIGFDTINVFFQNTPESKKICRSIKKQFPYVVFIPCDEEGTKGLRTRLLDSLSIKNNEHVIVLTDAYLPIEPLDLSHSIYWLEKTYAYRFYFNRHASLSDAPFFIPLNDEVCAWKFSPESNKWRNIPVGEDAFLSRKTTLYQEIKNSSFNTMYNFLRSIQTPQKPMQGVGLFFKDEKMESVI